MRDLLQRQFHFDPQVGSGSRRPRPPPPPPPKKLSNGLPSLKISGCEKMSSIDIPPPPPTCFRPFPDGQLVVSLSLIRITQDFVSFGSLLELFFRLFIAWVSVGMVFHGHLTVSLLISASTRTSVLPELRSNLFGHVLNANGSHQDH